jgi:serine/threonine protein kinase
MYDVVQSALIQLLSPVSLNRADIGLVAAHQILINRKNVLHRDISSSNILIEPVHNNKCRFTPLKEEVYIEQVLKGLNTNPST